ncbi:MAG: hypothetical protein B6I35_00630 [Anaerolineaceae bacterium 4572_32.2]|nr:MAG: hypothetical protein B6I35_00630 [Anaerolineaceae bacterium 4572_32.2]
MRTRVSAKSDGVTGPKDRPRRGSSAKLIPSTRIKANDSVAIGRRRSSHVEHAMAAKDENDVYQVRGVARRAGEADVPFVLWV